MNRELIERIGWYAERWHNYSIAKLLNDCKAEIDRLTLANEALSALNVEYLERVKALELPKQEPVAYMHHFIDPYDYVPDILLSFNKDPVTNETLCEPLYTSPNNHIVAVNNMINYVPMTDDEWKDLVWQYGLDEQNISWRRYVEQCVVRRMKEQGLI